MRKVWHDDIRKPPDESWAWARTNDEAKNLLILGVVPVISLDHDLGMHEADPDAPDAYLLRGYAEDNGLELVKWMIQTDHLPAVIIIHSWNPVGAAAMSALLREAGCDPSYEPYNHEGQIYA